MEDESIAHHDESSSEDYKQTVNGETIGLAEDLCTGKIPLDIVNGCDLSHSAQLENTAATNHLTLEENLKSEDFINNNKRASEQECFLSQRPAISGGTTAIIDQVLFWDGCKEFSISADDDNHEECEETLNPVHDSAQCSDVNKGHFGGESHFGQTNEILPNYTVKRTMDKSTDNNTMSQSDRDHLELQTPKKSLESKPTNSSKMDLLKHQENPVAPEETYITNSKLCERPKGKDSLDFKAKTGSVPKSFTNNSELNLSGEEQTQETEMATRSQDLSKGICNNLQETRHDANRETHFKKSAMNLQNSQCDTKTGTYKLASSVGHFDLLASSTACQSEEANRNRSLDFQTKRTRISLPKIEGTRKGKRKTEHQLLKHGKPGSGYGTETLSQDLELVEEEDLSEEEESSEDENIDVSLHYGCSRDKYVSDKLDPDVLHLLEMHLRKQQLVDIKEEGEEELFDMHVNKEKSRLEPFKLLRNIPPVLDMVLEEPELEHSGDLLDDDSKTPSEIDSDDSSNVFAMELGLMESLQHDLISKSSKIDKHEIAAILQGSGTEKAFKENKNGQKEDAPYYNHYNNQCESIKNKKPNIFQSDGDDLPSTEHTRVGDLGPDLVSECPAVVIAHDKGMKSELGISDSLKESNKQQVLHNGTEDFAVHQNCMGQQDQSCSFVNTSLTDKDLDSDVQCDRESQEASQATHTGTMFNEHEADSFDGLQTHFTEKYTLDEACASTDGTRKPYDIVPNVLINKISPITQRSKPADNHCPSDCSDTNTTLQPDGDDKVLDSEDISQTVLSKDLKANVKPETSFSQPLLSTTAEMNKLHLDLEGKILSILEKAHAADCRSSRLHAEAELLWKESAELKSECKSLSKEASELLSIFNQQGILQRHPKEHGSPTTKAEGNLLRTRDTTLRNKETLSLRRKDNPRNVDKGENQLQVLSKKYNFLRQEAPEIMQELQVLQHDLKSLPSQQSKPMSILYSLLWGGLITSGAMLLVWWTTKQLG